MMLLGLESVISLWAAQLSCYDHRDFTSHTVVELYGNIMIDCLLAMLL